MTDLLLQIRGLKTYFYTEEGVVRAVDGVDLTIGKEEVLGLVGESGCGKTVTAKSILRLIPEPPGKILGGEILFDEMDLLRLSNERLRNEIRGNKISMIFQDPMTSLNPVYTVGNQTSETFRHHRKMNKKEAHVESIAMLGRVGIPSPETMVREYPHRYSGGMRQRVMIAMALACNPSLLIADEPTTALDVTIQAQILELMKALRKDFHASILLITHNLGVVAEMADYVSVMYAGNEVESCSAETFFDQPMHPYSVGLLTSFPGMSSKKGRLTSIPGTIPDMVHPPSGCRFHPRCMKAMPVCRKDLPPMFDISADHKVRCWLYAS
ncbi:MAG: ABC transporter ATP-binding protein [Deltaproteobacteria bacterium]|nr:ABC transporter ATP-binding protein [Deltaproteobacteria bacterium]MBW2065294.1 ABC transporter ATP-binding protein [Deltaproteobacteria bacterium]